MEVMDRDQILQQIEALEHDLTPNSSGEDWKAVGDLYLLLFELENNASHLDNAIRYLTEAAERDPENARAHANLGLALMEKGSTTESMASLKRALECTSLDTKPHFVAHYLLGKIYTSLAQHDSALRHLIEAHRLDATHLEAWNDLGVAYARLGRNEEAKYQFRRILEEDPNNALALENLSRLEAVTETSEGEGKGEAEPP